MPSPFDILRVDRDADEEAIEQAYRRRVKETHPDHGGSAAEFQLVREAYEEIEAGERSNALPPDPEAPVEEPQETASRVEYLDYEVLDDHGWSLDDDGLFEKAADADLGSADHGEFEVEPDETLLQAAEERGFKWPFSCRGGACANCAVTVTSGDLSLPVSHVLPSEMTDRGIRLSCVGTPTTDELQVVYNVKHLPDLDELRLPPGPFEWAHPND